ncbi:MAG: diguanylate cyclase [Phycisphaerae bacterium]|nr:diguanylate cyclase [Phycisphaerae bacterium]
MTDAGQSLDHNDAPLILVVDDSEDTMRLVVKTLQVAGYRTLWAEDGATGLVIAEKYQPDAIVLDVQMPDMDGFKVCEELKSRLNTADIPVLFLTGLKDSDELVTRCYESGAHDLIPKPVRRTWLVARLQVVLRERALREVYKRLATQDPQTGLDNRRQTFLSITDAIITARRNQTRSAVILGDINKLADINLKYGYEFGDEIILTFARILRRFMSAECKIGRIAGNTLAVILKNTDEARAREFCERIERTFSAIAFDAATSPKHFTASFGVAVFDGAASNGDADDFMSQADLALSKAKSVGRGGVASYWEMTPAERDSGFSGKRRSRKRRRIRTDRTFVALEPQPQIEAENTVG